MDNSVINYFSSINKGGKKGIYCQRCGILCGKKFKNKKLYTWNKWKVCYSCFEDKMYGIKNKNFDFEYLTEDEKNRLIKKYKENMKKIE